MSKIERIENLNKDQLRLIMSGLARRMGYHNFTDRERYFLVDISSPLKTERHIFYLTQDTLSGSDESYSLVEEIIEISKKEKVYTVFIVSNKYISEGFKSRFNQKAVGVTCDYIDRDLLISLLERYEPEFWRHEDSILISYEKDFLLNIREDTELKKLKIFNDKYDKVLNIFIEPQLFSIKEDKESKKPNRHRISIGQLIKAKKAALITGDAGAGKSTILKKIAEDLVRNNEKEMAKKNIPILVTITDLYEKKNSIEDILNDKLSEYFKDDFRGLNEIYQIIILVDTIDELTSEHQLSILEQLESLNKDYGIKYFLGTRNSERLFNLKDDLDVDDFVIDKFNTDQIKRYVQHFFPDKIKAENLLDALKDNRLLERLPITPLTMSLISILFEEKNFEIPATIADIYDNFNSLLLGKATATSRIDLIDVSFTERILSVYAYELLKKGELSPFTNQEFITFFKRYFKEKSSPIGEIQIEEFLYHVINNSGILLLKQGKYVQFKHNSFLEYYAAKEYFIHRRNEEDELVKNFFDATWQNTAIFYGGMSKDMPDFLTKIIEKVKTGRKLDQHFSSVMGLGYLLQALYQTDNSIRYEGVMVAIEENIKAYDTFKKLASDNNILFKNYKLPIITMINMIYFFENFNSIALKHPLELAFKEYYNRYIENKNTNSGYRALKIALTLNSSRLINSQPLEELIFKSNLLNDATLSLITSFAIDMSENSSTEYKKELDKAIKKNNSIVKELIDTPVQKLRFSPLDQIKPKNKIKIIVEGKTDIEIIEHAYMVLTRGERPYWGGRVNTEGGANGLAKTLVTHIATIDSDELIIGIFDNDSKGLSEFNGVLKSDKFECKFEDSRIKKSINANIYGIRIPVPQNKQHYIQEKQEFNFFSIEHFFPEDFLEENSMLRSTGIPKVFEISGNKTKFAKKVKEQTSPNLFRDFVDLFRCIDDITGIQKEYYF